MNIFILTKDEMKKYDYTISINNIDMATETWYNDCSAIEWARDFVYHSFPQSTLEIGFEAVPDCIDFWKP